MFSAFVQYCFHHHQNAEKIESDAIENQFRGASVRNGRRD